MAKQAKPDALARKTIDVPGAIMAGGQFGGEALVNAALAQLRDNYGEMVLSFVTGQMDQMMRLKHNREVLDGHIQYIQDRVTAINAGEFTVSGYPPQINFNDPRLNDGL